MSLILSEEKWKPVEKELRDPKRSARAPPVPQSEASLAPASQGLRNLAPPASRSPSPVEEAIRPPSTPIPPSENMTAGPSTVQSTNPKTLKRPADSSSSKLPAAKKARKARSCCKCGRTDCNARGGKGKQACSNPCQDCGKVSCRGRNTKRKGDCKTSWRPGE